jgi:hypothetical protein
LRVGFSCPLLVFVARNQKYHKKRAEGSFLSGFNYSAFSHFSINKKSDRTFPIKKNAIAPNRVIYFLLTNLPLAQIPRPKSTVLPMSGKVSVSKGTGVALKLVIDFSSG